MARKPDMLNIRKRLFWCNGRREARYQVRIRLQDDRGVLKTLTQTFDTHEAAVQWRDDKRAQVQQGLLGEKLARSKLLQKLTLQDLILRYRTTPRFREKGSFINEFISLQAFLQREAALCRKPIIDLTQKDFKEYRDRRLYDDRVKPGTILRELNPIRHMFTVARDDWELEIPNPFYGLKLQIKGEERERILRPEERLRLYQAIEGCRGKQQQRLWVSLVILALTTALRRGELLKLEWRDIDLEKKTLYVRTENTKTRKSRILPMTQLGVSNVQSYWKTVPEERRTPSSKVFPISPSAHEQAWRRICKRAGIEGLHFHDLRHTAATSFGSKPIELTVRENAYMLGHKHPGSITGRYEHIPLIEAIRAKLNAAEDAWQPEDGLPVDDIANARAFVFPDVTELPWDETSEAMCGMALVRAGDMEFLIGYAADHPGKTKRRKR